MTQTDALNHRPFLTDDDDLTDADFMHDQMMTALAIPQLAQYITDCMTFSSTHNFRSDDDSDYMPACADMISLLTNAATADNRYELHNLLIALESCTPTEMIEYALSAKCAHQIALPIYPPSLHMPTECPHDAD